jgi:repressor LexA
MTSTKSKLRIETRRQRILEFLESKQDGYRASCREMATAVAAGAATITDDLYALAQASRLVDYGPGVARRYGLPLRIPLPVLGSVRAGGPKDQEPVEVRSELTETLLDALEARDQDYLLRVQGDSMVQAGIEEGDLVLVHPQDTAPPNGTIVLAQVNISDEEGTADTVATTLKRFYLEGNQVRLQPANDRLAPGLFRDPTQVAVRGIVRKVIRVFIPD